MASPTEHSLVQTPCAITFTNLAEGLQRATEALASLTAEKRKFASKVLRDTEALVQQRRKEVARWERTSLALQKTYAHKVRTHSFDLESLDASHAALQDEVDTHQRTRHRLESSLEQLDSDLAHARSEALRTAIKKRRRERNLNHYYFVPLFARYFKHKYVRSQTKNARWEDRVRELRTIADDSRAAMHAAGLRLAQIQKESVELDSQRQEAASRAASIQALLTFLSEGTEFWSDIASVQCEGVGFGEPEDGRGVQDGVFGFERGRRVREREVGRRRGRVRVR
ncbi:hypothetical protein BC938DRAFT_482329 [Jimgerdemannia flammicorona]|uniref:Uncharacterized protein n=1 Tax=Jimgerdemannia flammicorona TaxID=994334 RepID=A0A433QEC4_9FUNG|nr:hypothetical protein BC938DRAFT_482329 [Jimgerdemannia flammicorona]